MTDSTTSLSHLQSLSVDDFFYFFLQLRKSRIRAVVAAIRERYPHDTSEQLAQRLTESFVPLSFISGALLHLPTLLPGIGQALQAVGFVMGASALTRMHLYLILEIALLYGKDIDDQARVPEMMAVVAATAAAAATPLAVQALEYSPVVSIPLAGLTASATAQLIGNVAMRYYSQGLIAPVSPADATGSVGER
jgi:hypothetical protein